VRDDGMNRPWVGTLGVAALFAALPAAAVAQTAPADTTPPTITIVSPVEGATYAKDSLPAASFNCTDDTDPVVADCAGTVANGAALDTSVVGPGTFTVTAHDAAGNPQTKTVHYSVAVQAPSEPGGETPATLNLTLGPATPFAPFIPAVPMSYTTTMTARVVSSAGDATLTVADPSTSATGHLVNGAYVMPQPLQAAGSSQDGEGFPSAAIGGSASPTGLLTWDGPANEDALVTFTQPIGGTDALRSGAYAKTLTFTLSTTNP
jgi:hypothetical protein